ncbi:MAG: divergent PAP2 family protein [Oscillospiraceae bacterium]|nr:divergent PAP2 family protein [Oscillospiraceae bacterium]MBQ9985014.1 divergent PAP2 family protein [Oscillospiraceae bacterium]
MHWITDFFTNPFAMIGLSSWILAQVIKLIIHTIVYKKFEISRLFGDGGMPSGHSATVASLAVACALMRGTGSVEFAISGILAIVVCHDAMGVRLETGKQAVILNEVVELYNILSKEKLPEVKLKEFVGHTPMQVLFGVLLGIVNALLMYNFIFK